VSHPEPGAKKEEQCNNPPGTIRLFGKSGYEYEDIAPQDRVPHFESKECKYGLQNVVRQSGQWKGQLGVINLAGEGGRETKKRWGLS